MKEHRFGFVGHRRSEVWNSLNYVVDGILNASVVSIGVLIDTGVRLFLGKLEGRRILVFGSWLEGSETVDLASEGGDCLGEGLLTTVDTGVGVA